MYPVQCFAGFFNPVRSGKMQIMQVEAVPDDITDDTRVTLVDDNGITDSRWGRVLTPDTFDTQEGIIDVRAPAGENLTLTLNEHVTTRKGLSALRTDNVKGGTLKVYVR